MPDASMSELSLYMADRHDEKVTHLDDYSPFEDSSDPPRRTGLVI